MARIQTVVVHEGPRGPVGVPGITIETAHYPGDVVWIDPTGTPVWVQLNDLLANNVTTDRYGYGQFDAGSMPA